MLLRASFGCARSRSRFLHTYLMFFDMRPRARISNASGGVSPAERMPSSMAMQNSTQSTRTWRIVASDLQKRTYQQKPDVGCSALPVLQMYIRVFVETHDRLAAPSLHSARHCTVGASGVQQCIPERRRPHAACSDTSRLTLDRTTRLGLPIANMCRSHFVRSSCYGFLHSTADMAR